MQRGRGSYREKLSGVRRHWISDELDLNRDGPAARTAKGECPTGTPPTRIFFRCWHRSAVEIYERRSRPPTSSRRHLEFSIVFRSNHTAFPRDPHLEFSKSELWSLRCEVRPLRATCSPLRFQHGFPSTHAFPSAFEHHLARIAFASLFTTF